MSQYYERLPADAAVAIEQLSRLAFDLREDRRGLLQPYGVDDETGLLDRISTGEVPEHPAYDHYLGALALGAARESVRAELKALLQGLGG